MMDDFRYGQHNPVLTAGEAILWRGKPRRGAFIASRSLTLMPFAVIWLILDLSFIVPAIAEGEMLLFIIPFFALHMMPVWLWLGSMLTAGRRWKNTCYYVTNRRIIIQGGFLAVNETSLFYKDLRNASLRIGLLDKLFHTGGIVFDDGAYYGNDRRQQPPSLENLDDALSVYNRVQKIILDMQTDMEYPNVLRPHENPGYHTEYRYE